MLSRQPRYVGGAAAAFVSDDDDDQLFLVSDRAVHEDDVDDNYQPRIEMV